MFPQIFGKYVLEREIAAGGMARVYLATLRGAGGFEKRLVVKQIRPELASDEAFVRRFVEEAKTAVELSHPNIVPVYELGVEQGVYFIAMELCDGVSLGELLTVTGPLGHEEGAYVGIEICRALDYAHRRAGVVHRDVTPRNVLIDGEGAVRIIDFGIAAPVAVVGVTNEAKIEVFGSPGHMAPEQMDGRPLTPATDVFAIGVLLIEAWTGKPPYRRATAEECRQALRDQTRPPSTELPELDELVARAIAPDPSDRLASPEELARPLRRFVRSVDLGDVARRLGERVRETMQRRDSGQAWLVGDGLSGNENDAQRTPPVDATETRTFATRGELAEWTSPATRKLESGADDERVSEPDVGSITTSGRRDGNGGWRVALVAAAGIGVAALVGMRLFSSQTPLPAATTSAPAAATAAPSTEVEPTPPKGLPSASRAPATAPTPRAALPTAKPTASQPAASSCRLSISSVPPGAAASVDGRSYGRTPVPGIDIACGAHMVTLAHGEIGGQLSVPVTLQAGRARNVIVDWSSATPRVIQ